MAKYIPDTKQSLSSREVVGLGRGRGRGRGRLRDSEPGPPSRVSNYNLRSLPTKNYCENESFDSTPDNESIEMEVHTSTPNKECKEDVSPKLVQLDTPTDPVGQVKGRGRGRGRGKASLLSPINQIQDRGENSPYNLRKLKHDTGETSLDSQIELEHKEAPVSPYKVSPFKVSPYKVSPSKVSPSKVSPSKVSPYKVQDSSGESIEAENEDKVLSTKHPNFVFFWKTASPFSQFHPACFSVKGENYVCAEQYMMSNKAILFEDKVNLRNILEANDPKQMKHFGREVENFKPAVWSMCCRQIVQDGNRAKFSQNRNLLESLLNTNERYLIEASPFDRIWGIGMGASNAKAYIPSSWRGSNWLGEALNQVKFEIQLLVHSSVSKVGSSSYQDSMISELFKIGLCDKFDKMKCEIKISDDEKERYTDLSHANKKGSKWSVLDLQQRNKKQAPKQKTLFQFFPTPSVPETISVDKQNEFLEISEIQNDISNTDDFINMMQDWNSSEIDEKSVQNSTDSVTKPVTELTERSETNAVVCAVQQEEHDSCSNVEIPTMSDVAVAVKGEQKEKATGEMTLDEDPNNSSSILPPIDWPDEKITQESEESGIFSQFNEVSLKDQFSDNEGSPFLIPHSKSTACNYIFTDWAREKLLNNPDALAHFVNMAMETLQTIPGYCVYKSVDQLIAPCVKLSHVLIHLHTEFNDVKKLLLPEKDLIREYACAHTLPSRPQKYNLQTIVSGCNLMQESGASLKNDGNQKAESKLSVKSGKKSKKNKAFHQVKKTTTDQANNPEKSSLNTSDLSSCMELKSSPMELATDPFLPETTVPPILPTDNSHTEILKEDVSTPSVDSTIKRSNSDSKRSSDSSADYFTADGDTPSPKLKESKISKKGKSRSKKGKKGKK